MTTLLSHRRNKKRSHAIENFRTRDDERIKLLQLRRLLVQQRMKNLLRGNLLNKIRLSRRRTLITAEIMALDKNTIHGDDIAWLKKHDIAD